jgi:hypothetical protein
MLIDVSHNCNSDACHVLQEIDEDKFTIGFPFVQYFTQDDHKRDLDWLYPSSQLDSSATILCATNTSVDTWNKIAQGLNTSVEHIMTSKDTFSEVDDINGHLKKMLSTTLLNSFHKNGVPNHKLKLKTGDVCLAVCAIHGLGLANNSRIRSIDVHRYCVKVIPIGNQVEQTVQIPRISFRFRLQIESPINLLACNFLCDLPTQ